MRSFTTVLAHAGGWDEMLIALGAVFVVVLVRLLAERRRKRKEPADAETGGDPREAP